MGEAPPRGPEPLLAHLDPTVPPTPRHGEPLPARLRVVLLQARNPGDPARVAEHEAFARRVGLAPAQLRPVDIFTAPLDAALLAETDCLLVGGAGQYSVLDPLAPIQRFCAFLAEAATAGVPTFASCFGFQALVVGMGGTVVADEARAEVGTYTLRTTAAAAADPVFGALPATFAAQLGHKDQASVLAPGMVHLASSDNTLHQAYRVAGKPVWATQFHPELTWTENQDRFRRYMAEYGKLFGAEAAQRQLDAHRPSPEANTLLRRFVEHCFLDAGGAA